MNKEIQKQLSEVLRALRKLSNMSQEELAKKAGVSRQTIIGIEKGDNVSVSAIMAVVGVFMLVTSPFVSGFIASVGLPVLIDKLLKSKNEKE